MEDKILIAKNLKKYYGEGDGLVKAVDNVSLKVNICIPVIFLISILCPYYVYKSISKTNLVERISKSY